MLQATPDSHPLKQTAISAQKIIGSFDLKPEMKAIREALIRRRTQSLLDVFLAAQQRGSNAETTSLAEETVIPEPVTRDPVFVEACIRYLSERTKDLLKRNEIVEAMALIPDAQILPHLLDAFGWTFSFPRGIEAIALFGERAHPQLLHALRTGPGRLRFNAALALGFMKAQAAKPDLQELLPSVEAPTPRIGFYYALVRLGETQWLDEIVAALDDPGDGVRHAAAIALEHLDEPLDDNVYLRHLNDESHAVRLRLIRKLGSQTTDSVALVDALIGRLEDEEEAVRSAAADALADLDAELVYDRVAGLAQSGGDTAQVGACRVLGRLPSPEAVPLLLEVLQTSPSNDVRRAAILALGDLEAVDALGQLEPFLKVEELAHAAFWTILRIGLTNREAGVAALRPRRHKTKQLLLRVLLGENKARDELGQMLALHKDYQNLVEAMQLSFFLRDPAFEAPLRRLLTYRSPNRFPGDRYISHMALKALVYIELPGQ
jgi:HEAT repeat protein